MAIDHVHTLDLQILDGLEADELAPLSWGLVDGGFDGDELLDRIDELAEVIGDVRSAEEIRASLVGKALLTSVPTPIGTMWRTRMAETVRLTARLRQLFPNHLKGRGWQTAPTLVSDYRLVVRSRRFPRRNLAADEFLECATAGEPDPSVMGALRGLADSGNGPSTYSAFQARATLNILRNADSLAPTATLIAAGTGAGKTKAFYLPALAKLASIKDNAAWTKLVAIYPRTELLKDQIQKALVETRALHKTTGIRLTIGAFYRDTPFYGDRPPQSWPERSGSRVCPFLNCPRCSAEMAWVLLRGVGTLKCVRCEETVLSDEVLLSRSQMQSKPPDVLLSTTEMLNRQLANDYTRHIFGVGVQKHRRPRFLLLDEVHTFVGSSGAHTALLLRRWRHAVGHPVHTVGLSATLVDGGAFLAELAGVAVPNVTVVEPADDELVESGKEYLIALRGDPASGAALLSTTIQTAMLLRRTLDRPNTALSHGAFGTKAFVFTDDLDITNRLLHFLRNAEGQNDRGKPNPKAQGGSLANLRNHLLPDYQARLRDGQAWDLSREIGHDLTPAQSLRIERTSSQDPGLERAADIVVATASLEVGLDDDSVGAVIQHKAPRDAAAFIQRRGRAGRPTGMRPWTAVVLSDYGRDRQAFQAWDSLFDPVLRSSRLPVRNRHILRMQATFCLLDWLGERLREAGAPRGYVWTDLAGPDHGNPTRRARSAEELVQLLQSEGTRRDFTRHVSAALHISENETHRILWDPPRAVVASAIPTLIRRLESSWRRSAPGGRDIDLQGKEPLPDFLPSALFADLLVPEVEIQDVGRSAAGGEVMGVTQALREFAPGRVTHRFAVGHTHDRLWIPPGDGNVPVHAHAESDPLVEFPLPEGGVLKVLRPYALRPENPPAQIANSSNARVNWLSRFEAVGRVEAWRAPAIDRWDQVIHSMTFHLHQLGGRLVAYRVATGSTATVIDGGVTRKVVSRFVDDDGPVGLGTRTEVDALQVTIRDPGDWQATFEADPQRARSIRVSWFRECIVQHEGLSALTSVFQRNWLAELAAALVAEESDRAGGDLNAGVAALTGAHAVDSLDRILTVVFQSVDPTSFTGDEAPEDELNISKLHGELLHLASDPAASAAFEHAGEQLLAPCGPDFEQWLRSRYAATLAGAVVSAASLLDDQIAGQDLVADCGEWIDGQATMTFSETQPGGVGVVERLFGCLQQDPKRFWRAFSMALGPSEAEDRDRHLTRIVELATTDTRVKESLERLRAARGNGDRRTQWLRLMGALSERGEVPPPSVKVALSLRVLKPGSTSRTDALLHELLQAWSDREATLGLELEHRVFAYLASADATLDESLAFDSQSEGRDRTWRFNAIMSLLWPRGGRLFSDHLRTWSPFAELADPDRRFVADRLVTERGLVNLDDPRSQDAIAIELAQAGTVEVATRVADRGLKQRLLEVLTSPVEVGVLELYPRIVGVKATDGGIPSLTLELAEVLG